MSLAAKRAELETVKARGKAILDQYPNGGMPADVQVNLAELKTKGFELAAEIKAEREVEAAKADFNQLDEFMNKPEYRVAHGDYDGMDESTKSLHKAGWELKSGVWNAPTSTGQMQPMYHETVLTGDIPEDATAQEVEFIKTTRRAMQPDYRAAYAHLLRLCGKMHDPSMAWTRLDDAEQKALSEGTDTAGGFLVPPDVQAEMLVRLAQMSVIRSLARVQSTSRDVLQYPTVQAASATQGGYVASGGGSIFSSGFVGGWAGETPTFTDTDPAFGMFSVPIRKIRVATKLGNDFLADSAVNVLAFLGQNGAENMALVEDYGFVAGNGGPLQPRGILESGATTVDVEGSTANTISSASGAGSHTKIITLAYTLPSQYAGGATWLMKRSIEGKVFGLTDADGRPVWPESARSGLTVGSPATLVGAPVRNSEFMPADGSDTNKVFVFGNWSAGYIIASRAQITTKILNERFADTDQTGIIIWERVGGDTWNTDAFRIGVV
jgi:HK97 family phage major capsid protein